MVIQVGMPDLLVSSASLNRCGKREAVVLWCQQILGMVVEAAVPFVKSIKGEKWMSISREELLALINSSKYLYNLDVRGVDLSGVDFSQSGLGVNTLGLSCNFSGTNFRGCNLSVVTFTFCNLKSCDFSFCKAVGADLSQCLCQRTVFEQGDFSRANFSDVNAENTNFNGANVSFATFVGASLIGASFQDVQFNVKTILPDGSSWENPADIERFVDRSHPNFWINPELGSADEEGGIDIVGGIFGPT
jgi:hypothetical protein